MAEWELGERIMALTDVLYRIGCGLLKCPQDREDALQSTIEKAWRKASHLRDERKLRPWLARVMINECYSIMRKTKLETPVEILPEDMGFENDESYDLREALESLEDSLRLPLMLHYMEGFSIEEIASALRCPKGTVLSRMNRGRKRLKELLKEGF